MKTITICNQKGGVSKTTTAWTLGNGLHKKGYRVLFIDLDAQTNLSFSAKVDLLDENTKTIYEVFKHRIETSEAIHEIENGLDIIPSSIELASADKEFNKSSATYMLREALEELQNDYDYCIIDTPPTLGILTDNALTTCNGVIIPIKADIYALQGFYQLKGEIEEQRKYTNNDLKVLGLLITCVDEKTNLGKTMIEAFEKAAADFDTKVYETKIRQTVSVGESALAQTNLFEYAPKGTATLDYTAFVDEFLKDM